MASLQRRCSAPRAAARCQTCMERGASAQQLEQDLPGHGPGKRFTATSALGFFNVIPDQFNVNHQQAAMPMGDDDFSTV